MANSSDRFADFVLWATAWVSASLVGLLHLPMLLLQEIGCRLRGRRKAWYDAAQGVMGSEPQDRNALGLRDRAFSAEKAPRTCRIFVLGDSFTEGWGIDDPKHTFPKLLELQLAERDSTPGIDRYEVLNAGRNATLTHHWLDRLLRHAGWFQPDVVLAVFFTRDGTLLATIPHFFRVLKQVVRAERNQDPWARFSAQRRARTEASCLSFMSSRLVREFHRSYLGDPWETREWVRAQTNLLRMREVCSQNGVRFVLVNFPVLFDLDVESHPFLDVYATIQRFAEQTGINYLDLFPAFAGEVDRDLWISPNDQHPNRAGHRIAARGLYEQLAKLLG